MGDEDKPDPIEELVSRVNDGTRAIVNEILDERLRVNEPPGKDEGGGGDGEGTGDGGDGDGKGGSSESDPPPAPKTLAERLGF